MVRNVFMMGDHLRIGEQKLILKNGEKQVIQMTS